MSHQITSKGQVTIPKKVRDFLGLKAGAAVDFQPTGDGRVMLVAADKKTGKSKPSRFAALRGSATVRLSTRQIMALTRGGD